MARPLRVAQPDSAGVAGVVGKSLTGTCRVGVVDKASEMPPDPMQTLTDNRLGVHLMSISRTAVAKEAGLESSGSCVAG